MSMIATLSWPRERSFKCHLPDTSRTRASRLVKPGMYIVCGFADVRFDLIAELSWTSGTNDAAKQVRTELRQSPL